MPEFARISTLMSFDGELSFNEMLLFVEDLKTHCERDFDVVYLPQEGPIHGRCPTRDCHEEIRCLKKSDRSVHIHNCGRREIASDLRVLESNLKFCYECMKWFQLSQWRDHCSSHLQSWRAQHCEVVVYHHTVIRPGYCPFCLWNRDLAAETRLRYWLTSGNLRQHIEEQHMHEDQRSGTKPRCGCDQAFDTERELRHHLHDVHKLNKAVWLSPKSQRKRKRAYKAEAQKCASEPEQGRPKRLRFYRYPPPRHEYENRLSDTTFMPIPALCSFVEEHPEHYYCSSLSDKSTKSSTTSSVDSCYSAASSPLSSRPTTPGLEVIDPRILEPLEVHEENGRQLCDQDPMQTGSLEDPLDEHDIKTQSLDNATHSLSPNQSVDIQFTPISEANDTRTFDPAHCHMEDAHQHCDPVANQQHSLNPPPNDVEASITTPIDSQVRERPATDITAYEVNEEKESSRNDSRILKPGNYICSVVQRPESHLPGHQGLTDKITPLGGDCVSSLKKPLTRGQARQRPIQQDSNHPTRKALRQKLKSTDKRKLRELKSQNWTLRQIGPRFADIDIICLRQA